MPNWVHNTLTITGDNETLEKLRSQLNQPVKTHYAKREWDKETEQWVKIPETQEYPNPVFSFQNVIPIDNPETYYGDEYKSSKENIMEAVLDSMANGVDWYHWNCRNWGSKWDITNSSSLEVSDKELTYSFSTAWSPVMPVIEELARQYPTLGFSYRYIEEQGWGGDVWLENGQIESQSEWDIPTSHAGWLEIGEDCQNCAYGSDDEEYFYSDCPRETASV